jgi:hypothetical protein
VLELIARAGDWPSKDVPERYWPMLIEFIASVSAGAAAQGPVSDKRYPFVMINS